MLLPGIYHIFRKLRLSKAERPEAKRWLYLSEKMAKTKEQLSFLKTARDNNFMPASVNNILLPRFLDEKCMRSSKAFIKKYILRKNIRFLHGQVEKLKKNLSTAVDHIFDSNDTNKAIVMCCAIEDAFQMATQFHRKRLTKKLAWMRRKETAPCSQASALSQDHHEDMVTDLTKSLDEDEICLLSKGPKFALSSAVNCLDVQANFCLVANQLRWLSYTQDKKTDTTDDDRCTMPRYPSREYVYEPPSRNQELETKLRDCFTKIQRIINKTKSHKPMENLTPSERHTLKALKAKEFTYLPSDKGGEFCVVETTKYDEAALEHLSDNATYTPVRTMTAKTIESKINKIWKQVCTQAKIPTPITKSFTSSNTHLPVFYHLIKTHKTGPNLRIRPIVSNRGGPSHKLSWLLSRLLKPLLKTLPTNLENSHELLDEIKNRPESTKSMTYPFSLDVVALYTSVPQQEAITILKEKLEEAGLNIPFDAQQIAEILTVILQNTFFRFGNKMFRQVSGLPMGSNISAILAILYMDKLESQTITTFRQLGLYKRYVDDIFIITSDKETANEIWARMNDKDPHIKFEIEHPKDNTLSLLDFSVTLLQDGQTRFCYYKKPAKKNTFLHKKSAIPANCKINSIRNEVKRIKEKCTTKEDEQQHVDTFMTQLTTRGYNNPRNSLAARHKKKPAPSTQQCYLEFPYVNEAIHQSVKRVFRAANLPVRIYSKNKSLRSHLNNKKENQECSMKNCPLDSSLCLKKNCVYRMTCNLCQAEYIGSTKRALHQRVKEHFNSPASSVYQHRSKCHTDFKVNIVTIDSTTSRLRLKEAITIRERRPTINSKSESEELLHLIF